MQRQAAGVERVPCVLGLALLSACGGAGNGAVRPPAFTAWSAVPPDSSVAVEGISRSAGNTFTVDGFTGDIEITDTQAFGALENATATLSFDSNRDLRSLSISTPSARVSWNRASPGTSIVCNAGLCAIHRPGAEGSAANPYDLGWNYQTFGAWSYDTGQTADPRTGNIGAMSIGAGSPANALPVIGTANYSGRAGGFYISDAGEPFRTAADMAATVDFGTREIRFATSNTTLTNLNTQASAGNAALNLTGNLAIPSGGSRFSGPVAAPGAGLDGSATGSFYGPFAQEIGGVYNLKGAGSVEAMTGGFGGKRVP